MKPGLYVATVRGKEGTLVYGPSKTGHFARVGEDGMWDRTTDVTDARPLVVLDPESDEDRQRLAQALSVVDLALTWQTLATQVLRALAAPTPAEPMGLGAVVRDKEGQIFLRDGLGADMGGRQPWWSDGHRFRQAWSDIDVAEVLSEGVAL